MTSAIDGIWEMVRAELDGEAAPELVVTKTAVELGDGAYIVRFDGEIADRGTFEVGGAADTRTLVLRGVEGPNAGRVIPCIYQRTGDRLRVCYGLSGLAPTAFATGEGQQRFLATYRLKPLAPQV